ncbi:MAG: diguanylate cyclase [Acidobacteriaceae bacterium]|nr:diguanylate cyclase [Acidobacteriaceae bacterium]
MASRPLSEFSPKAAEILEALRQQIAEGINEVDTLLGQVAESAQALTGATGSAIALRNGSEILCRVRSGNTAPPLGSRLDVDSGISGECLLTGEVLCCEDTEIDLRVDREVCRLLGLRSMIVVPVRGKRRIAGILEVFSTNPYAFTTEHIDLLRSLAEVVESVRRRKSLKELPAIRHRKTQSSTRTDSPSEQHSADRTSRRFAAPAIFVSNDRFRYWIAGGAVALLLLAILMAVKTLRSAENREASNSRSQPQALASILPGPHSRVHTQVHGSRPAASEPTGVQRASKVDVLSPIRNAASANSARLNLGAAAQNPTQSPSPELESNQLPALPPLSTRSAVSEALLVPPATLPKAAPPVSEGVSGGVLEHQVRPVFPREATVLHLEGDVVLQATITKAGDVRDPKLLRGSAIFGQAAMAAVKQWHYTPYRLNGEPIEMHTEITVRFKAK